MVIPTEYDSHRPRAAIQPTSWVPPAVSVRIRVLRQLGQRRFRGGDVVGGSVTAGVAGAQSPRHLLAGSAVAVVDEPHQRVVAEGAITSTRPGPR
jgi:hypothetical protein